MRITPEHITSLTSWEVLVFGSNRMGIHGAGAARQALQWGAVPNIGEGLRGQTYALPTLQVPGQRLTLDEIQEHVRKFIDTTQMYKHLAFLVTAVGCGLAGFTVEAIAPLFSNCVNIPNVHLPARFWAIVRPNQIINQDPSRDAAVLRGGICPYCGAVPELVDSSVVYGRSYGMIYLCAPCDAYVGVHKGTTVALGRLANRELREWKKRVHGVFDHLWKGGRLTRNQAYEWLALRMNLTAEACHIGMFDVQQCRYAADLLEEWNVSN